MKNITCENIIEFVKRAFELENKFSVRYHQIELSGCKQVEFREFRWIYVFSLSAIL